MKATFILLSSFVISLNILGQGKNMLFKGCDIGDPISEITQKVYCVDSLQRKVLSDFQNCESHTFGYIFAKEDSSVFNFFLFETALITETKTHLVNNILLSKRYENYPSHNVILLQKDFDSLKNYLDKQMNVSGEDITEEQSQPIYNKIFKWHTIGGTYLLRKRINKMYSVLSVDLH